MPLVRVAVAQHNTSIHSCRAKCQEPKTDHRQAEPQEKMATKSLQLKHTAVLLLPVEPALHTTSIYGRNEIGIIKLSPTYLIENVKKKNKKSKCVFKKINPCLCRHSTLLNQWREGQLTGVRVLFWISIIQVKAQFLNKEKPHLKQKCQKGLELFVITDASSTLIFYRHSRR